MSKTLHQSEITFCLVYREKQSPAAESSGVRFSCRRHGLESGFTTGRTSFTFSTESRNALKNWAKRVSTNSRSPTEPSVPGVPIAAT
jgi:hypothetical protein